MTDGLGTEARAKVLKFKTSGESLLFVEEIIRLPERGTQKLKIRVIQALAQKGMVDHLIEKAQEMGVDEFWPVETKNSVIKTRKENRNHILARWQKKAKEAAKQSGSLKLTQIAPVQSFENAIVQIPWGEKIAIFHPDKEAIFFRQWLREVESEIASGQMIYNLCFGPEGGFAPEEIEFLRNHSESKKISCKIVSLGESILKIDTAVIGVMTALKLFLGEGNKRE